MAGKNTEELEFMNKPNSGDDEHDKSRSKDAQVPLFEDLLEQLGAFGHWQRVIFVLISVADIFGAWAILLPVFTSATPEQTCTDANDMVTNDTDYNISMLTNVSDYNNSLLTNVSDAKSICKTCDNITFASDFTSIITEWNLICDRSYIGGLVTSIQMGGVILGALVFAQLSDLVGRKVSYFLAHTIICCAGFACSFSNAWQLYAFLRLLVGAGFGGTMVVNSVYTIEFVGRRWRTLCGTIGFWGIGGMSLALCAYLIRSWRYLSMTTSLLGLIYLGTWFVIPESPRWLCQKGRFEEAEVILAKIAQRNKCPVPSLATLKSYSEAEERVEAMERKYTYWHLFQKKTYCRRMIALLCLWFVAFVIYYELSYNLSNLSGDRYLNQFLAGFVDTAGMLSVILFNNTLGRRRTMMLFMGITCVCNAAMLIIWLSGNVVSEAILVFALVGKASALSGTYVVQIFTAELFPTVIRNLAMGAGSTSARVATVIAPQIVFLGTYFQVAPYIICICLSAVVVPLCIILPETTKEPLLDSYDAVD